MFAGQARLERRVYILVFEADLPVAVLRSFRWSVPRPSQIAAQSSSLMSSGRRQHLGVRNRAAHVVGNEARIEQMILAGCIAQYALVERQSFFPEPAHDSLPCSAGVRAAMSSTTSVPVPSLVKTSSRMLSGSL